jgi:uncharacterized iron-regulated membrane protein
VSVVCVTGAVLVYRIELQRALYPQLFAVTSGPLADPADVMDAVSRAYPRHRLAGVDAPTTSRPAYLAYVTSGRDFLTVLIDPVSTRILGELPEHAGLRALQNLHFNLLAGRTGRAINGVGAIAILLMCATGAVLWWPGAGRWRRGFGVDFSRARGRVVWELHRALGIWSVGFIVMWALTGAAFAFPAAFRAAVTRVSPSTVGRPPESRPAGPDAAAPSWRELIDRARAHGGGRHVARVVTPGGDRGAFLVLFSDRSPTPAGAGLEPVYLDRFTGERLGPPTVRSAGDRLIAAMLPVHVGGIGGRAVKAAWFVFGLAPAVLFATGLMTWWIRAAGRRKR